MFNQKAFCKRLRVLRVCNDMTQTQVAEKLNLERSSISGYEIGRAMPPLDVLVEIAKLYGVSIDFLLIGRHL